MQDLPSSLRVLAVVAVSSVLSGQDDPVKPVVDRSRGAKLQQVCAAMTKLQSVAFATQSTAPAAIARGRENQKVATSGIWNSVYLHVKFGEDEANEVLFRGRHMIARDDDIGWSPRRGRLANGATLPFFLDPSTLFAFLGNKRFKVTHNEVGQVEGKPVETYTIGLTEDDARTLFWLGGVPEGVVQPQVRGGARVMQFVALGGGAAIAGRAPDKPDVTIDLAITFDPATRLVHAIRGRSITKGSGGAGGINQLRAVQIRGGFQVEEEEKEEKAEEEWKPGRFKNGLPVRAKKDFENGLLNEFSFTFSAHNEAPAPKLDAKARALLGLPR